MADKVHEFEVEMTCEGCSGAVTKVLTKYKDQGIADFKIDLPNKKVFITSNLEAGKVTEILSKTGKKTVYIGIKG